MFGRKTGVRTADGEEDGMMPLMRRTRVTRELKDELQEMPLGKKDKKRVRL